MWGRVVTYIGVHSRWEPKYALLMRSDGPMETTLSEGHIPVPLLFDTVEQAADWAQHREYTHIICDQLLGWKG